MKLGTTIPRQELEQFFDECATCVTIAPANQSIPKLQTPFQREELELFFSGLDFRLEIQNKAKTQLNRQLASEFNVFNLMAIERDENRLSDILKLLLDPRGAHGQKELFLKIFLVRLGRGSEPSLPNAKVVREALTHTISNSLRRIDILMTCDHLALAVENKVDAGDQPDQLEEYYTHIKRLGRKDYCLVFLTPDGREPDPSSIPKDMAIKLRHENRLLQLSYAKDIRLWLEECRRWCEAEKIRHFLADFIHYIETHLSSNQPEIE